ncbi:MAG: oligosaccharide flippase family protein [Saprospiraceae bacterium]|nr:oligosaccharide flippase family protein [Saprospiraceae bacterium]
MIKLSADLQGLKHLSNMSGGYFIATIIKNSLPFLMLPVLTRYLKPAEYGIIALFTLYLSISNSMNGVNIPTVVSKYFYSREKEFIARIIGNSIFIASILSIINTVTLFFLYERIIDYISFPLNWLLFVPLTSFVFIVFSLGLTVMRNSKKVLAFGIQQVGNTAINLSISIVLVVVFKMGWQGRIVGIIAAFIVSGMASLIYLIKYKYVIFQFSKEIIKKILSVSIPLIPNSLQAVIASQVGVFFIQYYYTKNLLGIYSLGFQLAFLVKVLGDTLSMSWSPFLYEKISGNEIKNKIYLTRMLYALIGVVLLGVLSLNLLSGVILKIMTTQAYYGAKEFIPWFSIGFLFQEIYVFIFPILIRYNKQKVISIITLLNMMIIVLFNIWFVDLFGYIGVSYAFCISHLLVLLACLWQVQRVMPMPWIKALKIW